jgi:hypothetical protein
MQVLGSNLGRNTAILADVSWISLVPYIDQV